MKLRQGKLFACEKPHTEAFCGDRLEVRVRRIRRRLDLAVAIRLVDFPACAWNEPVVLASARIRREVRKMRRLRHDVVDEDEIHRHAVGVEFLYAR